MSVPLRGLRCAVVAAALALSVAIAIAANASAANTVNVPGTASFWANGSNGGTPSIPAGISVAGSATATISVDNGFESPFPGAQNYPNSAVFLGRWFTAAHTPIALPANYPFRLAGGPLGDPVGDNSIFNPIGNTLAGNATGGFGTPGPYTAILQVPAGAATLEFAWYDSGYADNSGSVNVTVDPVPALPAGLVGWWKLDETSGTTAADSSGNGNSGAISSATLGQPGMVGTSFAFAGSSSSKVDIPTTAALRPAALSLSVWVKPTSFNCGQCGVASNEPTGGVQYGFGLRLNAGGSANVQWCPDGGVGYGQCAYTASNKAPLNQWTHIVAIWNGGTGAQVWVNGVLSASIADAAGVPYSSTQPLRIGGLPFGGLPFIGNIDDLKVFSRVLSPSEIVALASVTPPTPADTTAPVVAQNPNIPQVEATSPAGASIFYTSPTANDNVDGSVPVTCVPASGSTFAIGTTTVTCTARDAAGNTGSSSFTVAVGDTTPPVIHNTPTSITGITASGPAGTSAFYVNPTASDIVDGGVPVFCVLPSGSTFAIGLSTVVCTAADAHGNSASTAFTVEVVDDVPPLVIVPAAIIKEATGPATIATFSASANDAVDGPLAASCAPASGSGFPVGVTTVTCSATDSHGNPGSASFTVRVRDTTAPDVTVPANVVVEATSAAGATVAYAAATATDLVDGAVATACLPGSGTTFPLGTTTVSCSATDAAGNTGSAWFTVTVRDTIAPALTVALVNTKKGGDDDSEQSFRVVITSSDAVGVTGLTATLNGITVTNGQIVKLKKSKKGAQKVKRDDGKLRIEATSFLLTATARDAAGNATTVTATPRFNDHGENEDDEDDHGKKGGGKKDD